LPSEGKGHTFESECLVPLKNAHAMTNCMSCSR
jgi:hypothetical protein